MLNWDPLLPPITREIVSGQRERERHVPRRSAALKGAATLDILPGGLAMFRAAPADRAGLLGRQRKRSVDANLCCDQGL